MIKLSVCIPIYGVERYIEKCLRSLFEQTLKDSIEYIFVNDSTYDSSMEILHDILDEYQERTDQVRIIEHESNSGLGATRLTALKAARGEYVIFCDSDDWVATDMYETMLDKATATGSDIVVCDYYMDYGDRKTEVALQDVTTAEHFVMDMMENRVHCGVWNKMIRRDLYMARESVFEQGIDMWEDVCAIIPVISEAKSISHVNRPLYYYNQQNALSYTHNLKDASLNSMKNVIARLERYFVENKPQLLPGINFMKLTVKLNCLLNTTGDKQQEYVSLYPEADISIMRYDKLSPYWRIALMAVRYNQLWLFNFLKRMNNFLKR